MSETSAKRCDATRDVELINAARQGDHAAFAELIDRHKGLVHALAYAITGSLIQSEEIVQEAFIAAWKKLPETDPHRFHAWLCGIARVATLRLRRDEYRRFRRFAPWSSAAPVEIPSAQPSPLEEAISHEEERFLWRALGALPELYRVPLVLFYREQESIANVADALGLKETVVKMRLSTGRRMLQKQVLVILESTLARMKAPEGLVASVMAVILAAGAGTAEAAKPIANPPALMTRKALVVGAVAIAVAGLGVTRYWGRGPTSDQRAVSMTPAPKPPRFAPDSTMQAPAAIGATGVGAEGEALAVSSTGSPPTTVMTFDFEDGILPTLFTQGFLAPGPTRPGNRYCVVGSLAPTQGPYWMIVLGSIANPPPIFSYSSTTKVGFDYWAARDWSDGWYNLDVQVWNNDRGRNFHLRLPVTVLEQWQHAEVKLSDLMPYTNGAPPMREGDGLGNLTFTGGVVGGNPFYMDNIRIVHSE